MSRFVVKAWPVGWTLVAVGFIILVGGSLTWVGQYVAAASADQAPSWLVLFGSVGSGVLCNVAGLTLLAASADRKNELLRTGLKRDLR